MSRPSTCLPCRTRKKCDGVLPYCGRCVRTNRSPSCTYVPPQCPKQKTPALQKGEACIPCRNKKKRCDATRPICQRCAVARYQDECEYNASSPDPPFELSWPQARRIMARRTSLLGDTPEPCPAVSNSSQSPLHPDSQPPDVVTIPPRLDYLTKNENENTVPPPKDIQSIASTSFARVQPLQEHPDHSQPHITHRYPRDECLIQPDPTSPYYAFQDTRMIPNPIIHIYMANNMNPRMFSLQNISPDTLNLLFRFGHISHLVQFAVFYPVAKLQAIILGDTSATFIHPCFIHLAHLIGCHLHQDNRLDYSLNRLELLHLNTVCHALEAMDRTPQQTQPCFHIPGQTNRPHGESELKTQGELDDPFTYAQIRFMFFLYALLWRSTNVASRLLKSVFSIVKRNDIRFVPEHKSLQAQLVPEGFDRDGLPVPGFTESDYERVVFLASLIGADAGLQLFSPAREAEVLCLDLERQFFDEFPVTYPTLAQMPLVWRNRGLLLLNHAISLQRQHKGGKDVIQLCKDLINSRFFVIEGLPNIIALHEDDHEGHLILRCAAIMAHTAMAILLRILSEALSVGQGHSTVPAEDQAPPVVYRRRCRKSLKEAIRITRGLADPDFSFIDVVMTASWIQITTITAELDQEDIAMGINSEMASPPPSAPPALKSPMIKNAQPMTRAEQIRQQQVQYRREHQHQRTPLSSQPPSSSPTPTSVSESSRSSSASPPHQATTSEVNKDRPGMGTMPSIDGVTEGPSDLQLLEKSVKQLQASFWRPIPETLTSKMHMILEGLRVVTENQEGVYYNH